MSGRSPADDTLDRPDGLYKSDEEIARLVGVGPDKFREIVRTLEKKGGFPPRDPIFCNRRYWPAVRVYLDRRNKIGGTSGTGDRPRWEENFT